MKQSTLLVFKPGEVSSEDISGSGLMHKILRVCLEELARTNQWIHLELTRYKRSIHNESEGAWAPSVSVKSVSFKQNNDAPIGIRSVPSTRAKLFHNVAVQKRSHEYHLGKTTLRNPWLYLPENLASALGKLSRWELLPKYHHLDDAGPGYLSFHPTIMSGHRSQTLSFVDRSPALDNPGRFCRIWNWWSPLHICVS